MLTYLLLLAAGCALLALAPLVPAQYAKPRKWLLGLLFAFNFFPPVAGLGRESLYKALSPGAKPRFDTVLKVARALGVRLSAQPV